MKSWLLRLTKVYWGFVSAALDQNLLVDLPVFCESKSTVELPHWKIWNLGTKDMTVQIGQKIGTWTAGVAQEVEQNKELKVLLYLAVPYPKLTSLILIDGEFPKELASFLWKWA